MREIMNQGRTFLSEDLDTKFTVIYDGFGTFILISNDAYGDVKIVAQGMTKQSLELDYNIKL